MNAEDTDEDFLPILAHRLWTHWSRNIASEEDISEDRVARWRNLWVPFDELPSGAKKTDRELVERFRNEEPHYKNTVDVMEDDSSQNRISEGKPDWGLVAEAADLCEYYADRLFDDGCNSYTAVTRWDDGDFRVVVHHGMQSDEVVEDGDYIEYATYSERVIYKHFKGWMMYTVVARYPDRQINKVLERKILAKGPLSQQD